MKEQLSDLVVVLLILLGQAITAMALDQGASDPVRSYSFSATNNCVTTIRVKSNGKTYKCSTSEDKLKALCPDAPQNETLLQCLFRLYREDLDGFMDSLSTNEIECQEQDINTGGIAAQFYGTLAVECQ